jgi:hypothetical protein
VYVTDNWTDLLVTLAVYYPSLTQLTFFSEICSRRGKRKLGHNQQSSRLNQRGWLNIIYTGSEIVVEAGLQDIKLALPSRKTDAGGRVTPLVQLISV